MFYEVDRFLRRNKDRFYHNTIAMKGVKINKMIKLIQRQNSLSFSIYSQRIPVSFAW